MLQKVRVGDLPDDYHDKINEIGEQFHDQIMQVSGSHPDVDANIILNAFLLSVGVFVARTYCNVDIDIEQLKKQVTEVFQNTTVNAIITLESLQKKMQELK